MKHYHHLLNMSSYLIAVKSFLLFDAIQHGNLKTFFTNQVLDSVDLLLSMNDMRRRLLENLKIAALSQLEEKKKNRGNKNVSNCRFIVS